MIFQLLSIQPRHKNISSQISNFMYLNESTALSLTIVSSTVANDSNGAKRQFTCSAPPTNGVKVPSCSAKARSTYKWCREKYVHFGSSAEIFKLLQLHKMISLCVKKCAMNYLIFVVDCICQERNKFWPCSFNA